MRFAKVALLIVVLAGCNGAPAANPVSVTPAPAPTGSPTEESGRVAIVNDGRGEVQVKVTILEGTVDRVALIYLNGTTRVRPTPDRVVKFDTSAGVIVAIEPIGRRVTSKRLTIGPWERRGVGLSPSAGPRTVLLEVQNSSLARRVVTATGGWTVLSSALLVTCRDQSADRLEFRITGDAVSEWPPRC